MKIKFGKHWMVDLYLCQNKIWEIPETLMGEIERVFYSAKPVAVHWSICKPAYTRDNSEPEWVRIGGAWEQSFFLLQVFPAENFVMMDIFTWDSLDFQQLSENLINLLAPQVIASESKLRAEHLAE